MLQFVWGRGLPSCSQNHFLYSSGMQKGVDRGRAFKRNSVESITTAINKIKLLVYKDSPRRLSINHQSLMVESAEVLQSGVRGQADAKPDWTQKGHVCCSSQLCLVTGRLLPASAGLNCSCWQHSLRGTQGVSGDSQIPGMRWTRSQVLSASLNWDATCLKMI